MHICSYAHILTYSYTYTYFSSLLVEAEVAGEVDGVEVSIWISFFSFSSSLLVEAEVAGEVDGVESV